MLEEGGWGGGGGYQTGLFWLQVTEIQFELAELKGGFIRPRNPRKSLRTKLRERQGSSFA